MTTTKDQNILMSVRRLPPTLYADELNQTQLSARK